MREFTRRAVTALLASAAAWPARAQSAWPAVTLVVPFPPGGSTDALARLLAPGVSQRLVTNVIVENKGGAMGSLGAVQVAMAPPNGSSFLVTFDSHALLGALIERPPLDIEKDLEPVLLVGTAPYIIAAHPSLPYNTFADVVAAAKQKPISYSSAGPGTLGHLAMVLLGKRTGAQFTHVPYKGAGPAIVDTTAGHVDMIIASIAILLPQIEAGKLKPLMQTGRARADALKSVPTAVESGFADFEASAWWGIFTPKDTPADVIARANAAFTATLRDKTAATQLRETQQVNLTLEGPDAFRAFFARQIRTWGDVVRENNIKVSN